MAILITGGAGFIGCYLVHRLVEADQEVVVFDINIDNIEDKDERATYIQGDISNLDQVREVIEKYDFDSVFHLASILP
ncbi:MAG: SDR family NAD(P)-dependent oxidoreductase, partial [Candidatus Heimdallarchaeota archaeon]